MNQFIAHDKTKADLDAIIASPKANYMLVGPLWSGKRQSALYLAQMLHCGATTGCVGCKRIVQGTDPDVVHVAPNEKGIITIEMAHDLINDLAKLPHRADATRVVVIESADTMTIPAQNALLKLIEEPPARTIFLLLVTNTHKLLATITSRSQVIYMRSIPSSEVARGRAGFVMNQAPELIATEEALRAEATAILDATPFERIMLVDHLSKHQQLPEIIDWLAYLVSARARQENTTSQSLQTMQNYFIYSAATVAQKHALTEMMIRL